MVCIRRAQARLRDRITGLVTDSVGDTGPARSIIDQYAERFPDPEPPAPTTAEPPFVPPAPRTPDQPAAELPRSRKPDRDAIYEPDEPDEDDRYFRNKSWLV